MADLSPAEIMLNDAPKIQSLIRRLESILAAPVLYAGISLSSDAKAHIAAFRDVVQRDIDELSAQREKCVALVKLIPDQTARTVIELHYQLTGSGCTKTPYSKIGENLNYSDKTIFRYRQKGIDQLNQILEDES